MSLPLVKTLCAAAAARRSPASSSWGRGAAAALAASPSTPTTLALPLGSNDHLPRVLRHLGGRRCFSQDRGLPLRRTTTNDIVGGRSTIGVFTPITASLWIERLRREEGATLPPKPAEGPLPPSWARLQALKGLHLYGNQKLSGPVSKALRETLSCPAPLRR